MRIEKSNSKRVKIISTAVVAVVLLGLGVTVWNWYVHKDDIKRDANGVSIERTAQDKKLEEELNKDPGKKELVQSDRPEDPSVDSNTNLKSVNVILTNTGMNNDNVTASGFVSNVVESDGTCTFVFTNDQKTLKKQSETLPNPTSTTCKSISFNKSELGSGTWKVQIQYSSSESAGMSNEMELVVR